MQRNIRGEGSVNNYTPAIPLLLRSFSHCWQHSSSPIYGPQRMACCLYMQARPRTTVSLRIFTQVSTLIKEKCKLLSCARGAILPNIPHHLVWSYFIECPTMAPPSPYGNSNMLTSLIFCIDTIMRSRYRAKIFHACGSTERNSSSIENCLVTQEETVAWNYKMGMGAVQRVLETAEVP